MGLRLIDARLRLAPKFATGANVRSQPQNPETRLMCFQVVPVAGRLTLGHDAAESRAEPEGDTTLALVMIRGVGPGNIAARDIIPIGNGASFNMITAPMEERRARTQPKVRDQLSIKAAFVEGLHPSGKAGSFVNSVLSYLPLPLLLH